MYGGTGRKLSLLRKEWVQKCQRPLRSHLYILHFPFKHCGGSWSQFNTVSLSEYIPQGHWFYCSLYFIYHIFYAFLTVTLYYRREKSITKLPSQRCTLNDKSTTLYKFEILFVKEEMHSVCWCSEYKSQLALSPENCPQSEALISSRPWHDFTLSRFVSVVSGINNTWDPVGSTSSRKACEMYSLTVQV